MINYDDNPMLAYYPEHAAMWLDYRRGMSQQQIAEKYRVSQRCVSKRLRQIRGYRSRGRGNNAPGRQTMFTDDEGEMLVEAWEAGETTHQLAERFQCSRDTILRTMRRTGWSGRPKKTSC